jgi:predicted GIY-YIG superfamily endonuclease
MARYDDLRRMREAKAAATEKKQRAGSVTIITPCFYLYRHFDQGGRLLYVGASVSPLRRLLQHQHCLGARWFDRIVRIEIERFATREAALAAEKQAIKIEKPEFNVLVPSSAYHTGLTAGRPRGRPKTGRALSAAERARAYRARRGCEAKKSAS